MHPKTNHITCCKASFNWMGAWYVGGTANTLVWIKVNIHWMNCCYQGTHPLPFEIVTNSIVCTDASNSLLKLFNLTSGKIRKITFPSRECKTSYSRCDKCLQDDQCQVNGELIFSVKVQMSFCLTQKIFAIFNYKNI